MKLGSLFDGSGGFPLGGIIAGLTRGNGVALPCVVFVLCGIVAITENEKNITK